MRAAIRTGAAAAVCDRGIVAMAALSLMLASMGCARAAEWQGTIEERDGVVYVHNPAQGLWESDAGATIRFELEQTFGAESEPAEATLNGIWRQAFDVDDDGNVYIYDGGDERLVSFARDGSLRWSAGGPGQGPGEFSGAEGMAWNGASIIYVTNGRGARVDKWSTDGEFLESRSISDLGFTNGSLVGVLDEHTVVLQSWSQYDAGVRVGVIDLLGDGTKVADFDVDISSGPPGGGAVMEVEIIDGSIAVGDWDSYELRFFSRQGELERVVSRAFDHMVTPASMEDSRAHRGIVSRSWLKPPLALPDGMFLATASWTDADSIERLQALPEAPPLEEVLTAYRHSFDLFDAEGRYLVSLGESASIAGIPDEVDAQGNIYTVVMDPYPHVRRYGLVIER